MNFTDQIKFIPCVGKNYLAGFQGVKALILGESHYQRDGKAYDRGLNVQLILGQADQEGIYPGKYPFWSKIVRLLSPNDVNPNQFWHSVAYYNYIQEFVGLNARDRPTKDMWMEARAPFFEVMATLKPDFILVLGKHLWERLPAEHCYDIESESIRDYCRYVINGHSSFAAMTRHPSSFGFRYSDWQPDINDGLRLAAEHKSAEQ